MAGNALSHLPARPIIGRPAEWTIICSNHSHVEQYIVLPGWERLWVVNITPGSSHKSYAIGPRIDWGHEHRE